MHRPWLLLVLSCLLFAFPMAGQVEHAPTPDQCRADADAWGIPRAGGLIRNQDQFATLARVTMRDPGLTADTLNARDVEFGECVRTDSVYAIRYSQAQQAYAIAELGRMANFMRRHNLTQQFLQEDEQGNRRRAPKRVRIPCEELVASRSPNAERQVGFQG